MLTEANIVPIQGAWPGPYQPWYHPYWYGYCPCCGRPMGGCPWGPGPVWTGNAPDTAPSPAPTGPSRATYQVDWKQVPGESAEPGARLPGVMPGTGGNAFRGRVVQPLGTIMATRKRDDATNQAVPPEQGPTMQETPGQAPPGI